MNKLSITLSALFLCSCSTTAPFTFHNLTDFPRERVVSVLIATATQSDIEPMKMLVEQFNAESRDETGITINPTFIHFSMTEQMKKWPKCRRTLPCFADYVCIYHQPYDIAIYYDNDGIVGEIERVIVGGAEAQTDTDKYRYIILHTTSYDRFKHEFYHVFHPGHSMLGLMRQFRSVAYIPLAFTALSDASKAEITANKWRKFE